jgi:uncharacterized protein
MPSVVIRFYEELNDFLPPERRKRPSELECRHDSTLKSIIEDLGVPHTEVDLLLVNGRSAGFSERLHEGDRISVYPVFESFDIGLLSRVRPFPLRVTRFALDVHLGKLARMLRMFGFDSSYSAALDDGELVRHARREGRIVLSRDRGLLKRRVVTHGYLVRSGAPREQAAEVIRRFDLAARISLFSRCMSCNLPLQRVDKTAVLHLLPSLVRDAYEEFSCCSACDKVYWRGTHWERMKEFAEEVLRCAGECGGA